MTCRFNWEKQILKAEKAKRRRDKCKASHNKDFVAKRSVSKIRELLK